MNDVREAARVQLPTSAGEFDTRAFECSSGYVYLALIKGDIGDGRSVLTRVHSECLTGDALGSLRCDCGVQLDLALRMLTAEGRGVLIYATGHEGRGIGLIDKLRAYMEQEAGADTLDANLRLGLPPDGRHYDDAAAVLDAVGIRSVRLITNNPRKVDDLQDAGITIEEAIPLPASPHLRNRHYLHTKRDRFGHVHLAGAALTAEVPGPPVDVDSLLGVAQPPDGRPFVLLRYAQTLDGRIATASGDSTWISGEAERRVSHALRAACDAVLVGVGTVLANDPQLTVRKVPGRSPARVILDSRLRSPIDAAVFRPDAPTYVMTTAHAGEEGKRAALAARQIAVRGVAAGPAGLDIAAVIRQLYTDGIRSIMVEGGARVITSMLAAGVVDRIVVSIAPRILGRGTDAVGDLHNEQIADAVRLYGHSVHLVGDALLIAADLGPPASLTASSDSPTAARHA